MEVGKQARRYASSLVEDYRSWLFQMRHSTNYCGEFSADQEIASHLEALRTDGLTVIPQIVDLDDIAKVREDLSLRVEARQGLLSVSLDSERSETRESKPIFVSVEALDKATELRSLTNQVSVAKPLLSSRHLVALGLDNFLLDLAGRYLRALPAIGSANLRRSFVNQLPPFDTQFFHSDPNCHRFLKAFFYLQDVSMAEGGAFQYVLGSHRRKFLGWRREYRYSEEQMRSRYSDEKFCTVVANAGDVIVADTTGFHRGLKPVTLDRDMATINLVPVPEDFGRTVTVVRSPDSADRWERTHRALRWLEVVG